MKRLLLPLLAALALPTACSNVEVSDKTINAEISDKIHKRCKDVSDYAGCVKANKDFDSQKTKKIDVFGFRYHALSGVSGDDAIFNGTIFVFCILYQFNFFTRF